jgi:hypothetical protein
LSPVRQPQWGTSGDSMQSWKVQSSWEMQRHPGGLVCNWSFYLDELDGNNFLLEGCDSTFLGCKIQSPCLGCDIDEHGCITSAGTSTFQKLMNLYLYKPPHLAQPASILCGLIYIDTTGTTQNSPISNTASLEHLVMLICKDRCIQLGTCWIL